MSNPYNDGTFFWYWYEWWFPVIFATVALIVGVGILITTDRKPYDVVVRILALLAFVGTFTLAQERIGFGIKADEGMVAVISILGGFGSVVVGAAHFMIYGRRKKAAAPAQPEAVQDAVQGPDTMAAVPGASDQPLEVPPVSTAPPAVPGGDMTLVQDTNTPETPPVADEPPPPGWLVFQSGTNAGQTIPLAGTETTIGRGADNDVVVDDEGVSRQHAAITFVGGEYQISDVGSAGGTLLDGAAAEISTTLESGATVRLGKTDLLFMQGQPGAAPRTPSAAAATEPPSAPALEPPPVADAAATMVAPAPEPEATLMAWLAVTDGPSKGATCQVNAGETRIGRGDDNHLIIGDAGVSRNHAVVMGSDSGMILLDLASSGGTRLNGEVLTPTELSTTSLIVVGETELMLIDVEVAPEDAGPQDAESAAATIVAAPAAAQQGGGVLVARKGPDAGKTFQLTEGDNVIGRADATVQLSDPQVSRRHAIVRRSGDKFIIYDLGSTAGTIVDGQKVEGTKIKGTDTITLGGSTIVVMEPSAG